MNGCPLSHERPRPQSLRSPPAATSRRITGGFTVSHGSGARGGLDGGISPGGGGQLPGIEKTVGGEMAAG